MKLIKAMATVAFMTGLSRIAGFIRDVLTAQYMGAGLVADAFFVALKLPNLFRRITAEGAFSIAFVPVYTKKLEIESEEAASKFASNAFMVMLCWLSVFSVIMMIAMPYLMFLIAPGFEAGSRFDYAVEFTRITFPYLLLMSLTSLLGGVMNAHDRFAPFAFAPTLFNLSMVGALLVSGFFPTVGHALSWGLFTGGVLQLILLLACARYQIGFTVRFAIPKLDSDVKRVLKLMVPAMIGAGVVHINLFADIIMASFLPEGSISHLYYADRLNQLPLGMVGIAVGTALLPMLSRAMTKQDSSESVHLFNRAMEVCLVLALPAAIALSVMPQTLIGVLFERGEFTAADTLITSQVLFCYAIGLPAYICIKVFSTAHWARHDTVTPVRISIVVTILNIVLGIIFMQYLGVVGLALGTGLVAWVQFVMHVYTLRSHPSAHFDAAFIWNMPRIVGSAALMGIVLYALCFALQSMLADSHTSVKVLALGAIIAGGGGVYGLAIIMSGVIKLQDLKRYFVRRKA